MNQLLALLLTFTSFTSAADTVIATLKSDRTSYAVGENAVLRATLHTRPENPDFQFDIVGRVNSVALPVERTTDFNMFSTLSNLESGTFTWEVDVVLQDAAYAKDLKASILYFDDKIEVIDNRLLTETDPVVIDSLILQKERYEELKSASQQELSDSRTLVQSLSLTFTAQ